MAGIDEAVDVLACLDVYCDEETTDAITRDLTETYETESRALLR